MPASKASAAVLEFKRWLQDTIACITAARLTVSAGGLAPSPPGERPHTVSLGQFPVPLDGPNKIALSVDHHYRIVRPTPGGRWKIQTAAYYYAFDAQEGREILAYHWHPGEGNIALPHLHLGRGAVDPALLVAAQRSPQANALRADLAAAHLPTGRIALEDFVYLAIQHFGVPAKRRDWEATLRRSRQAFEGTREWVDRPRVE